MDFRLLSLLHCFISDASFAESLYGLRRRAVNIKVKKDNARLKSNNGIHHSGLEKHQRVLSVVFLVNHALILLHGMIMLEKLIE